MSRCFNICPIGVVENDVIACLVTCIETRCGISCKVSQEMVTPRYAYDEARRQFNSKLILKRLLQDSSQDILGLMGVTREDLYVPVLKYVYGLAQLDGLCSLISIHRLLPEFYGQPPDRDLLISRIEKTALHELGHSFGLMHCRDRRCVMYPSTRIEDTVTKHSDFCTTCFELFSWHLERRGCLALTH